MSIIYPPSVSRVIRLVNDQAVVEPAGQKCILYRFEGWEELEDAGNVSEAEALRNEVRELHRDSEEDPEGRIYSEPIETKVYIDWQKSRKILGKRKYDGDYNAENPITHFEGDVPLEARFFFDDFVTRNSYIKTPVMIPNQQDNYDQQSEKLGIDRLQVSSLTIQGQENVSALNYNLTIHRGREKLADSDTDLYADVPSDFWEI